MVFNMKNILARCKFCGEAPIDEITFIKPKQLRIYCKNYIEDAVCDNNDTFDDIIHPRPHRLWNILNTHRRGYLI